MSQEARTFSVAWWTKTLPSVRRASRHLHDLADIGVLREMPFGKEKLFIHPKLVQLTGRDSNQFQHYA